ncbi:MAG: hypothetical protein P9M15_06590 [Candidatus Electryoneaceae bacterium]|nr:hypothetical protein [Candidatus Electryoneaceae bacterium]
MSSIFPLVAMIFLWGLSDGDTDTLDIMTTWEWTEYSDRSQALWGAEACTLPDDIRVQGRLHIRADRRFGVRTEDDLSRYDGSAISLTQRYSLSVGQWHFGTSLDKDRYEPSLADLSRFYGSYKTDNGSLLVGDFHITAGYGLSLWTRPHYYDTFDAPTVYRYKDNDLRSATETQQNSGLRGFAASRTWNNNKQLILFASRTLYDASIANGTDIQRLSNSGLHRTDGENLKKNSITETAAGGTFQLNSTVDNFDLDITFSGYTAHYNPPFTPAITPRDRFPFIGKIVRSFGFGAQITPADGSFVLSSEIAQDRQKHTAWMMTIIRNKSTSIRYFFALYHYPRSYLNPHSRPPTGTSEAQNQTGTALMITGRPSVLMINHCRFHLELERHQWRTWTIPCPSIKAKSSVELHWKMANNSTLIARYRRKDNYDGNGEENEPSRNQENKIRLTWSKMGRPVLGGKIWLEGVVHRVETNPYDYGIMVGGSARGNFYKNIRCNVILVSFLTQKDVYIYIGEGSLPDRIASVRLNGRGFRWLVSLTGRQGRWNWLAIQASQTLRRSNSGDTELYVTLSHKFNMQ